MNYTPSQIAQMLNKSSFSREEQGEILKLLPTWTLEQMQNLGKILEEDLQNQGLIQAKLADKMQLAKLRLTIDSK